MAPATLLKNLGIPKSRLDVLVARTLSGSVSVYANYMGTSGGGGGGMSPESLVADDVPLGSQAVSGPVKWRLYRGRDQEGRTVDPNLSLGPGLAPLPLWFECPSTGRLHARRSGTLNRRGGGAGAGAW